MTHKIIDLFSGAGGLTTGFHLAGFESLCAIELNSKALATYKHNYPNAKIINADICKVDPSELRSSLGIRKEELTALIGGPPCPRLSSIFVNRPIPRKGTGIKWIERKFAIDIFRTFNSFQQYTFVAINYALCCLI